MIARDQLATWRHRLERVKQRVDVEDVPWLVHTCDRLLTQAEQTTPRQAALWEREASA